MSLHELRAKRATIFDAFEAVAIKKDFDPAKDQSEYDRLKGEIEKADAEIERYKAAQDLSRASAKPIADALETKVFASPETSPYANDAVAKKLDERNTARNLTIGGVVKMLAAGGGLLPFARETAKEVYGESHPVTKALVASVGTAGGFFMPPDYLPDYVELLRARTVVRRAGPRTLPMPRGTMRLPSQTSAASASYGAEDKKIPASQPGTGALVATYKKEVGFVPISNDLLRYADPAIDAFVRDDLVKVMALREDLAFLLGDGTQDTPKGFLAYANARAVAAAGTAGVFSESANSTLATGGNFVTSTAAYTLATVVAELSGAAARLDRANVVDTKRAWFMHPDVRNYLYDVQNSLGEYVFRSELDQGKLRNCPLYTTTQIPKDYWDASGTNKDLSFVFFVEMTEAMLFDAMTLELAVSRETTYSDANGVTQSAFQNDETVIRAIAEHDFLMRHDEAISVIQGVRWAPA